MTLELKVLGIFVGLTPCKQSEEKKPTPVVYGFGLGRRRTMGEKGTHALLLNDRTRWDVGFRKTCGVRNIFTVFSLLKESLRKGNNWVGKSFAVKQWLKYVVYT